MVGVEAIGERLPAAAAAVSRQEPEDGALPMGEEAFHRLIQYSRMWISL